MTMNKDCAIGIVRLAEHETLDKLRAENEALKRALEVKRLKDENERLKDMLRGLDPNRPMLKTTDGRIIDLSELTGLGKQFIDMLSKP